MIIHFICLGNIYRSRLAEAYLNSKQLKNIKVISSGIKASDNGHRPISWLTQKIFEAHKLVTFESLSWTQTTKKLLDSADINIFFNQKYYQHCVDNLNYHSRNYEIWPVSDLRKNIKSVIKKIAVSEATFKLISQKVDDLIVRQKF